MDFSNLSICFVGQLETFFAVLPSQLPFFRSPGSGASSDARLRPARNLQTALPGDTNFEQNHGEADADVIEQEPNKKN